MKNKFKLVLLACFFIATTKADDSSEDKACNGDDTKCVPWYLCPFGEVVTDGSELFNDGVDNIKESDSDYQNDGTFSDYGNERFPESRCSTFKTCCVLNRTKTSQQQPSDDLEKAAVLVQDISVFETLTHIPWSIAVLKRNMSLIGGGSLISPKVILTAAHTVFGIRDVRKLTIRGGKFGGYVERNVKKIVTHEDFNRTNLQNDLALLVLDEPFEITASISPIALPFKNTNFDNQQCLSSGWGKYLISNLRKKIDEHQLSRSILPIIPSPRCQATLAKTRLGEDFELHEKFLCAGGEEGEESKEECFGDPGGPLACQNADKPDDYFLAGILVGDVGCGKFLPRLFADVSRYRQWIDDKMNIIESS